MVERFADGGITVWARAVPRGNVLATLAVVTFILIASLMTAFTNGRPWSFTAALAALGPTGLCALAASIVGWLTIVSIAWRRETRRRQKNDDRQWDVVGVSPKTVYVDVEARKAVGGGNFEVPRAHLRDIRLTYWKGPGGWAQSVELTIEGSEPVNLCWGFTEREIAEAYEALSACLETPATANRRDANAVKLQR